MKTTIAISIAAIALGLAGCAHSSAKQTPAVAVVQGPSVARPTRNAPSMAAAAPIISESPSPAVPFIKQAKWRKVALRGYIDEKGRAVSPQEVVQRVEADGINPDALDNWDKAYIPAENIDVPAGMGSPVMATVPKVVAPDSDLIAKNPEETIVTGYVKYEDKPLVDSMARETGRVPHFDSGGLGWVLLKK